MARSNPSASPAKVSAPAALSAGRQGASIREFAGLDGCDEALVRRALRNGKLKAFSDGSVDRSLAGTGWRKSNRNASDASVPAAADNSPKPGRLTAPVLTVPGRPLDLDEVISAGLADEFIRKVLSGEFADLADAERIKENGLALKHLLDARRKAGALIPLEAAQDAFFRTARDMRDAWMGWVPRIAVTAAAELNVEVRLLTEVLTRQVHLHLSELGEPEFDAVNDAAEG